MDAVALAAGELAYLLLLVGALEIEGCYVAAARHLGLAQLDLVSPVGDFLPYRAGRVQRVARLVDVAQLDRLAHLQRAALGLLLPDDHAKQRGLAGAVGPDDADDAAGRQAQIQIVDQQAVAIALAQLLGHDDEIAQPRAGRNADLARVGLLLAT